MDNPIVFMLVFLIWVFSIAAIIAIVHNTRLAAYLVASTVGLFVVWAIIVAVYLIGGEG